MKRLYTLSVLALFALLFGVNANAESLTLNVPDPSAVNVTIDGYKPVEINAGENVVEFSPSSYSNLYITARDGYQLVSVKGQDASYGDLYVNNGYQASLYLSEYCDGRYYTVEALNLDEARDAEATIEVVDDYTLVRGYRNGGSAISLTGATTAVKFISGSESPFTFQRSDYQPFYSVTVDGKPVTGSSNVYACDVVNGSHIVIQAKFPDMDVPVIIEVPEGCEGAISSVSVDYSPVQNWNSDDFTVKAGSRLNISFDSQNYSIDGVEVNGVAASTSYFDYVVGAEPVYIVVDAHAYASLNFTLKVDDPARVSVYQGDSQYSSPLYSLQAGENSLSVGERVGRILIKAASGSVIKSITDGEGNPLTLTYDCLTITDGMYINIETGEKVYDGKFSIYLDSEEGVSSAYWSDEETRSTNSFHAGYTLVPFSTESHVMYMVNEYGQNQWVAYKNGEPIANNYSSTYFSQQFYPSNGDVIKIYTQGAPDTHAVTVTLSGNKLDDVHAVVDKITHHTDFSGALNVLTGTHISFPAIEGVSMSVSVDGERLSEDEDGNYSFIASGNHDVQVSASSGVDAIGADDVKAPVYNLQGIRVLDNASAADLRALPAGLYIFNGAKIVVR